MAFRLKSLLFAGSSEEIKAISMAFDGDSAAQLSYQPVNDALLENPAMSSVSPGVSTVLRSVVAFASYRKWRYTQVISENGVLGQELVKQLKREGSKKGICVGAEHYYSGGGFQQIVDAAAAKMEAKILILNLNPMDAREFLVALNKSDNAGNFIVFSARTLSMVPSFAQFTRTIQTALYAAEVIITASPRYLSFLSGIRANSTDSNPWFDLWYEQVFSCSLDADNMRQYTEVCSDVESTPITSSPQFEPNFWYMNVINSVRLAASALHETLETFCGEGYNGICTNFYNDDMRATFMRNLRDITFMDEQNNEIEIQNGQGTVQSRVFDPSRVRPPTPFFSHKISTKPFFYILKKIHTSKFLVFFKITFCKHFCCPKVIIVFILIPKAVNLYSSGNLL